MNIIRVKDYDELSKVTADIIIKQIKKKENSVLGLATGSTPVGTYKELVKACDKGEVSFSEVRTFNLDEYIDVPTPQSYHTFMYDNLFSKVDIDIFKTNFPSKDDMEGYELLIDSLGIDLQILGIGVNGHIGFNEPNTKFDSITHVVKLSDATRESNKIFFDNKKDVPTHAVTMGLSSIMKAKRILLLISGEGKADILDQLIETEKNEKIPASILLGHNNVTIIATKDAFKYNKDGV